MILFENFMIDLLFHFTMLLFIIYYFKFMISLRNNQIAITVFITALLITYINHIYFNKLRVSRLIDLIKRD
jgi:hypothetical protein